MFRVFAVTLLFFFFRFLVIYFTVHMAFDGGDSWQHVCCVLLYSSVIRYSDYWRPIPMASRSKAGVCGHSLAGIAGSNPTGTWASFFWALCFVRQTSPRRPNQSSGRVLSSVCVRRSVRSSVTISLHLQWVGRKRSGYLTGPKSCLLCIVPAGSEAGLNFSTCITGNSSTVRKLESARSPPSCSIYG